MTETFIQEIAKKTWGEHPINITRKTVGKCNEVYELTFTSDSFILRMNNQKEWMYGTHKFLPIFQKLDIKTPHIIAEDYSKTEFPFCYQIQNKLEGKDLGLVIDQLSPSELKGIAAEISNIFDKFNTLPPKQDFGGMTGMNEERISNMWEVVSNQRRGIAAANEQSKVLDPDTFAILDELLNSHKSYFLHVEPKLYYDDINAKNVMIHNGKFVGLVDLDFLRKGDYLVALGAIIACWHGEAYCDMYMNELIKQQGLNADQHNIIRLYSIIHMMMWITEEGVRSNSNTSSTINWDKVKRGNNKIMRVYQAIKG